MKDKKSQDSRPVAKVSQADKLILGHIDTIPSRKCGRRQGMRSPMVLGVYHEVAKTAANKENAMHTRCIARILIINRV